MVFPFLRLPSPLFISIRLDIVDIVVDPIRYFASFCLYPSLLLVLVRMSLDFPSPSSLACLLGHISNNSPLGPLSPSSIHSAVYPLPLFFSCHIPMLHLSLSSISSSTVHSFYFLLLLPSPQNRSNLLVTNKKKVQLD